MRRVAAVTGAGHDETGTENLRVLPPVIVQRLRNQAEQNKVFIDKVYFGQHFFVTKSVAGGCADCDNLTIKPQNIVRLECSAVLRSAPTGLYLVI